MTGQVLTKLFIFCRLKELLMYECTLHLINWWNVLYWGDNSHSRIMQLWSELHIEPTLPPHSCLSGVFLVFMCVCYFCSICYSNRDAACYQQISGFWSKTTKAIQTDSSVNVELHILYDFKQLSIQLYRVCLFQTLIKDLFNLNFNRMQFWI